MYKIYILYPPTPNCTIHSWSSISSQGCAWSEGWANFLQAAIQNDQYYDDTEDQNIHRDYEPPNPIAQGADVEGAVTASLWDIYDSHIEDWDSISLGINSSNSNGIWNVVYNRMPNTTIEFIGDWVTSNIGYNCEVETIFSHHKIGGNCIYIPLMIR
jgi:hypothetical protein